MNSLSALSHETFKSEMLIQNVPAQPDRLSHRERSQNRAYTQSLDMTQPEECQRCGHGKAAYVKDYLYLRVACPGYLGKLARKKVGRNYGQSAAVGKRYADT